MDFERASVAVTPLPAPSAPTSPTRGEVSSGVARRAFISPDHPSYFPAVTSTFSLAVRPKRSGRYMSSTLACGRTYLPGDTARTT